MWTLSVVFILFLRQLDTLGSERSEGYMIFIMICVFCFMCERVSEKDLLVSLTSGMFSGSKFCEIGGLLGRLVPSTFINN